MKIKNKLLRRILQLKKCSLITKEDIQAATEFYANKSAREEITICMATHPPKKDLWRNAYFDLQSQCDRFILVLGGYDRVPNAFLDKSTIKDIQSGKLRISIAGKDGLPIDKGCQNKFMFYGDFQGYYCTFDDDIRYSENCVYQLIQKYEQYKRKAIVSFHGEKYPTENGHILSCYDAKRVDRYLYDLFHGDAFVHLAGGGCMAVRPFDFSFDKDLFLDQPKNMGDDEILAIWAQQNEVPLVAVDNTHCILKAQEYDPTIGLNYRFKRENHKFTVLNSYDKWHLVTV